MALSMEGDSIRIISSQVAALGRPDLYRQPLVSFSWADDSRYPALKRIIGEWHLNPGELLPDANSLISYFVPFTKEVVMEPKKVVNGSLLWGEAYQEINRDFDLINDALAHYLNHRGYSALSIKSTHTYDPGDLKSSWSHRSAAVIAGLGAFGANRFVITEKGSGGRFSTVITSAHLKAQSKPVGNKCLYFENASCRLCLRSAQVALLLNIV